MTNRHRDAALFEVPEVDALMALNNRNGSTLDPALRAAWSGERLGYNYVDQSKRVTLAAHTYRLCLVIGVQPKRPEDC